MLNSVLLYRFVVIFELMERINKIKEVLVIQGELQKFWVFKFENY